MGFSTILLLLFSIVTGISLVLFRRLRRTERELERSRLRMARLDEIADDLANRESDPRWSTWPPPAELDRPRQDTPADLRHDSGRFEAAGLQFDTEDTFDDDFAAPQMAAETSSDRQQRPSRPHHRTPVGSPRTFAPRPKESVVEVGSIQVRSEELARDPDD